MRQETFAWQTHGVQEKTCDLQIIGTTPPLPPIVCVLNICISKPLEYETTRESQGSSDNSHDDVFIAEKRFCALSEPTKEGKIVSRRVQLQKNCTQFCALEIQTCSDQKSPDTDGVTAMARDQMRS